MEQIRNRVTAFLAKFHPRVDIQCDVIDSIVPMLWWIKVVGLFPYKITTIDGRLCLTPSIIGMVQLLALSVFWVYSFVVNLPDAQLYFRLNQFVWCFDYFIYPILLLYFVVSHLWNMKRSLMTLNQIKTIDETIKSAGLSNRVRNSTVETHVKKILILMTIAKIIIFDLVLKTVIYGEVIAPSQNILEKLFEYAKLMLFVKTYAVVTILRSRYAALNKCMEELSVANRGDVEMTPDSCDEQGFVSNNHEEVVMPNTNTQSDRTSFSRDEVEVVQSCHDQLGDVFDVLNETETTPICISIIVLFLMVVLNTFYFFSYWHHEGNLPLWFFIAMVTTLLYHTSVGLFMLPVLSSTRNEGNRMGVMVHKLWRSCRSEEAKAKKQLSMFSQQLLHRPLRFSGFGFFPLDHTMVLSVANAVAAYSILLLHFQSTEVKSSMIPSNITNN